MSTLEPLPIEISAAIEAKVGGVLSQRLAWQHAASRALANGLPLNDLVQVMAAFSSSRSLDQLTRLARGSAETFRDFADDLRRRSDDSSYALHDWLSALEAMLLYLDARRRDSAPSTILGYVDCASEFAAASGGSNLPLRDVVLEMLEQHGFDG